MCVCECVCVTVSQFEYFLNQSKYYFLSAVHLNSQVGQNAVYCKNPDGALKTYMIWDTACVCVHVG